MNLKEIKLVLDVLNCRADELKTRVDSHEKFSRKLDHLSDVVRNSSLDANYISDLIFLIKEKDTDIWTQLFQMNAKIDAIDHFVGNILQSLNDNDESCIYLVLDDDINV